MPFKLYSGMNAAAGAAEVLCHSHYITDNACDLVALNDAIDRAAKEKTGYMIIADQVTFADLRDKLEGLAGKLKGGLTVAALGVEGSGRKLLFDCAQRLNLPFFEPFSVEDIFDCSRDALSLSFGIASPSLMWLDADIFLSYSSLDSGSAVSRESDISRRYNKVLTPPKASVPGGQGLAVCGSMTGYVYEALEAVCISLPVLNVRMPLPFPDALAVGMLERLDELLVFDYKDSLFFSELERIKKQNGLPVRLRYAPLPEGCGDKTFFATRSISDYLGLRPPAEPFLPKPPAFAKRAKEAGK